jgi:hypothetical protein
VSTTASYYIEAAADDVRSAMTKLEERIAEAGLPLSDTNRTVKEEIEAQNRNLQ